MNYSEMTDFEINKAVAGRLLAEWYHNSICLVRCDDDNRSIFNPCNSWADAGPIIQEESISLIKYDTNQWRARSRKCLAGFIDINPLRAAMIVLLMMREGK